MTVSVCLLFCFLINHCTAFLSPLFPRFLFFFFLISPLFQLPFPSFSFLFLSSKLASDSTHFLPLYPDLQFLFFDIPSRFYVSTFLFLFSLSLVCSIFSQFSLFLFLIFNSFFFFSCNILVFSLLLYYLTSLASFISYRFSVSLFPPCLLLFISPPLLFLVFTLSFCFIISLFFSTPRFFSQLPQFLFIISLARYSS
ncbi:unnamed protein product [Acanthosepion pharaonis]|uniref:Uncharacterized protein n=1 Tax=Acanthosepion pharaonis TaxID=158019 RepID=A0A812EY87_ACAPH|nr:unnamed protein product [Sepia pharaonis]